MFPVKYQNKHNINVNLININLSSPKRVCRVGERQQWHSGQLQVVSQLEINTQ